MAGRSSYDHDVDFATLGLQFPAFNKFLKSNGQLDFSNPEAVQQLTKSLLERDFALQIDLPPDRLCPPVPNRYNYVAWIQELLDSTSDDYTEQYDLERRVIGLDIGTGSSCIYPLLGCAARPGWKFAATDIDEKNMEYAKRNIMQNDLKSRIRPLLTKASEGLFPLDILKLDSIDFTMCNPPFYSSDTELVALAASKSRPPHSACTGAAIEMVTDGGEVGFVSRMIDQSKEYGDRCQWFTSMLGKTASLEALIGRIKAEGICNWAVRDLVQGNKTKRWAIAWSWSDLRPAEGVCRRSSTVPKHLLPFPTEFTFSMPSTTEQSAHSLNQVMESLDMHWRYKAPLATGVGIASRNVWSRAARRRNQQRPEDEKDDRTDEGEADRAIAVKVRLSYEDGVQVVVRWLQGHDHVLFESFYGMLRRSMRSKIP